MLNWTPHEILPIPTDEDIAVMEAEDLIALHTSREEAIRNADKDPFRYGFKLEHWFKAWEQLDEVNEILCLGGNRCLAPDQEIYDPVFQAYRKVSEIEEPFHVVAWDAKNNREVIARAGKPFKKKKRDKILHFWFSDGGTLRCSGSHLIFCCGKGWVEASVLKERFSEINSPNGRWLVVNDCDEDEEESDIWDFNVPIYNNYFIGNVLSHNSGKTAFGSYSVVRAAIENPGSIIMCFAQSAEVSIRQQQSAVYNWLPPEYRMKQTSSNAYISYTLKNGFTDNSLILPNKSQILFKTYSQYQNNPIFIEGAELGSKSAKWHNIGAWLDEYLLGDDLINTMRFRLATRNSKMLVTFTPIDGWTEVIKDYLDKAKTIATKEADLLNGEILPHIQRSHKRNASIHYFHTKDNPFSGYERLASDLKNESREKILIRAYGVPVKSQATKFPKFNKEVNVIPQEMIPTQGITRYHIIDPAGSKNWFMAWIAVDGSGTYYVYREWPDTTIGDWAEWKGGKWMPGEGAKGLGYGMKDYVDLIHELEGEEEIYNRIIDPRLGAAKYQAQDGSSSIIEDLAENDIICIPAPGLDIEDGLQALISKMSWDTSKPMDSINRPRFYVSEECRNIISALSEYTGEQGLKEAWKDPLDCLRYAAIYDIDHVEAHHLQVTRQGTGGY
jgi:hypothetical protein